MTIAAAYLTSEGVVLGADSLSTITDQSGATVQLLSHEQKIYEIGNNSTWGLCTFGDGRVGDLSHRTIAALIGDKIAGRDVPIDEVIAELSAIIIAQIKAKAVPESFELGYFVGGHDATREPKCSCVAFQVTGKDAQGELLHQFDRADLSVGSVMFQGAPEYFGRVFHGIAPGLPESVLDNLKKILGSLPANFEAAFATAFAEALIPFASEGYRDLPLREAIDYVHTYVHLSVKAFKFRYGAPVCGGPLEIAYVSTDRQFRWARHKRFDSAIIDHHRSEP